MANVLDSRRGLRNATTQKAILARAAIVMALFGAFGVASLASAGGEKLAWQATEYVAPDSGTYFPDDEDGARRLDEKWRREQLDAASDQEAFSLIRNGLRRTRNHRSSILRWLGTRYIWNRQPQNPEAIEIMYQAADFRPASVAGMGDTYHSAVYFGLSVVKPKTPSILRALVDLCMAVDDPNDLGQAAWGAREQREELLAYLKPYLQSPEPAQREKALVLEKIFKGELEAFDWARERARQKAQAEFTDKLPAIKEDLKNGDSARRKETLRMIMANRLTLIMDDSFIDAFAACAGDADAAIRREVARTFGEAWLWSDKEQNPKAIELMLALSKDPDRDVRYNAVYFGLSTVRLKDRGVVMQRLVQIAMSDREPNMFGRIVWGLKSQRDDAAIVLNDYLTNAGNEPDLARAASEVYRQMTGQEPPRKP